MNETTNTLRLLNDAMNGLENVDLDVEIPNVDDTFDAAEIASDVVSNIDIESAVQDAVSDRFTDMRSELETFKNDTKANIEDAQDAINSATAALSAAATEIEDLSVKVEELEKQLAASISIAPELREPLLTFLAAMALSILPKAEAVEVVAEPVTPRVEVI